MVCVGVPPLGGILRKFRLKPGLQPTTAILSHYTSVLAAGTSAGDVAVWQCLLEIGNAGVRHFCAVEPQ